MMRLKELLGLALLSFLCVSAAKASLLSDQYTVSWAAPDFFPLNGAQIYVRNVENETGHSASFDAATYLTQQIRQRLSEGGATMLQSTDANAVIVEVSIHLFQEGSAFGRWLAPGAGTAYAVVRAHFRKDGHSAGADLLTVSVIAAGGLYSLGAEKTVLEDAADEIAAFLQGGVEN